MSVSLGDFRFQTACFGHRCCPAVANHKSLKYMIARWRQTINHTVLSCCLASTTPLHLSLTSLIRLCFAFLLCLSVPFINSLARQVQDEVHHEGVLSEAGRLDLRQAALGMAAARISVQVRVLGHL